ncbi:MAG: CoA transferase [Thermoleophilia bacterium]|nr:CoA transferase [Thermoleophilia bacterium]
MGTAGQAADGSVLEGIRVLDVSQGAAGPTCGALLGDLGADVVKVEPPGGEWGRVLGPPFTEGVASAFLAMNRNKRSVVVDLKRPGGADVVRRLARGSDVVLESFRPGVADRLGIGYEDLAAGNPRLVYVAISAWGQEGPWRDQPGVDGAVQAVSGIMSVTGTPDGPPVKVGTPAADMSGGFVAVQAVLAALYVRERTGRGQRADVSLLQSLLAFQLPVLAMYLATGEPVGRLGSAAPYAAPNEAYATRDGHLMVAAYTPDRWPRLCAALGRPELAGDPRFDTNEKRVRDRGALREELEGLLRARTTAEWVEELGRADVICAPLLDYGALVQEPHLAETGALWPLEYQAGGTMRTVANPLRLEQAPPRPRRAPPHRPGESTCEVLREHGLAEAELERLLAGGVVEDPSRHA